MRRGENYDGCRGQTHPVLFDEVNESCPFDFDGLALSVVEGEDEVEEITFAEVARGLLLVMRPSQTNTEI